jgi:hypothetical protein
MLSFFMTSHCAAQRGDAPHELLNSRHFLSVGCAFFSEKPRSDIEMSRREKSRTADGNWLLRRVIAALS